MTISAEKAALRKKILTARGAMGVTARAAASKVIRRRIRALPQYLAAKQLAAFAPLPEEADIWPILEERWEKQAAVALPRITSFFRREMVFHSVKSKNELESGPKKIWQPKKFLPVIKKESFDFALIPAVAMDETGYRLGYGGGFYDTLFTCLKKTPTCVPVFLCQRVVAVPREAHDCKLDFVISE